MDYLNSILGRKRADLKKLLPLEGKLRASAIQRNDYAGFRTAVDLGETRLSVVPEISRVHPALRLREGVQDIRHMYGMFLQGGAQGISIAVEPEVYGGSWDMVSTVSRISSIPVMARDVFIHPAMICQAIVSGADAVNLVAAALPAKDLSELYRMASGLGASAPWKTRAACWTQEPMAFFSKTNLPAWIFPRISWRPFWLSGRTDFPLTIL